MNWFELLILRPMPGTPSSECNHVSRCRMILGANNEGDGKGHCIQDVFPSPSLSRSAVNNQATSQGGEHEAGPINLQSRTGAIGQPSIPNTANLTVLEIHTK
jgi:hypothetical protein